MNERALPVRSWPFSLHLTLVAMLTLSADLFAQATDPEAARYRVLAGLKEARQAFARSRVYPHLGDIVRLRRDLTAFLDNVDRHREAQPGRVSGVDWESGALRYTPDEAAPPLLAEELARWALPLLSQLAEEGRTLYEFVDAHAALTSVGLVPAYQGEGFLVVPDEDGGIRALRYTVSAIAGHDGRYRSLRTAPVAADLPPLAPPQVWKEALVRACPDLPAPATFLLQSDVPFPVEETMLPVAKRKLLALVTAWGEA